MLNRESAYKNEASTRIQTHDHATTIEASDNSSTWAFLNALL